jgi:hypothetical protein
MTRSSARDERRFQAEARTEIRHLTGEAPHRAQQERIAAELLVAPFGTTTVLPLVAPILATLHLALSERHRRRAQ